MCVVSIVYDHYFERFDQVLPVIQPFFTLPPSSDVAILRKLIEEFRECLEAAKKVDSLTGKSDCVDPEKQKLEDRINDIVRQLDVLENKG